MYCAYSKREAGAPYRVSFHLILLCECQASSGQMLIKLPSSPVGMIYRNYEAQRGKSFKELVNMLRKNCSIRVKQLRCPLASM